MTDALPQTLHPWLLQAGVGCTLALLAWSLSTGRRSPFALTAFALRAACLLGLSWLAAAPQGVLLREAEQKLLLLAEREQPRGAEPTPGYAELLAAAQATTGALQAIRIPAHALDLADAAQVALLLPQTSKSAVVVAVNGTEPLRATHSLVALQASVLPGWQRGGPHFGAWTLSVPPAAGVPVTAHFRGVTATAGTALFTVRLDGQVTEQREVFLPAGEADIATAEFLAGPGQHSLAVTVTQAGEQAAATADFVCAPEQRIVVVSADADPVSAGLLRAQGRDVLVLNSSGLADDAVLHARCVVFERVPAHLLATPSALSMLQQRARRGLGWIYLPELRHGLLAAPEAAGFAALLPASERPPEPAVDLPPPPEQKPDPEQAPDPAQRTKEKRTVPTLGLVVAIDASGSMQGEPLRLAKEAAWAAVQVLHPEDFVGVIAFNKDAKELLQLTRAGDKDTVKDRIARIQCGGGTDFSAALRLAEEVFAEERLSVKHLILLSDGESEPGRFEALTRNLVRLGITVSTVGCGRGLNVRDLSNIAAAGQGKFYPAYAIDEVPEIFAIEAERVITQSGARRAPKPDENAAATKPVEPPPTPPKPNREEKPAPPKPSARSVVIGAESALLQGITAENLPEVAELLRLEPKSTGSAVLRVEGEPLLVHGQCGAARVVQLALPLRNSAGPGWEPTPGVQRLLAQASSWCEGREESERATLNVLRSGRTLYWRGEDLFRRSLDEAPMALVVATVTAPLPVDSVASGQWSTRAGAWSGVALGRLQLPGGATAHAAHAMPPRAVDRCALPVPEGVDAWRAALAAPLIWHAAQPRAAVVQLAGEHALTAPLSWILGVLLCLVLAAERLAPQPLQREDAA